MEALVEPTEFLARHDTAASVELLNVTVCSHVSLDMWSAIWRLSMTAVCNYKTRVEGEQCNQTTPEGRWFSADRQAPARAPSHRD